MGDRHGDRFARRGRALSPPRPQVDAHRGVNFRWRATVFRWRGVVGRICPRRNTPLGESLSTRRTSERICPAQEHAPRRKPLDTAHERKDLPRARTLPSAKASRHGARAKEFAPRRNALLGEGLPTRRTSERICPAQEPSPRRRPPDTAHEQKNLPAQKRSPRRRPPDTARRRRDLPRARRLSSAKASRHGARAKGFAPRRIAFVPRADERRAALGRRTARKTPLRRGRTHSVRPLPSSFT